MFHFKKCNRESPYLQPEEVSKLGVLGREVLGATFHLSMLEEELLYFALGTSQVIVPTMSEYIGGDRSTVNGPL